MTGQEVDRNHFPTRLHIMISTLENDPDGLGGVVSFQPHGRVFMIRNTDVFVQQILPKWFCRLKYTSFQRQLCLYGFRKLSKKGPDQGGYYHLNFIRDRLDLASTIQPGKIKGKRGRRPKSDESEPDFYQMPSAAEEQRAVEPQQPAIATTAPGPQAQQVATPAPAPLKQDPPPQPESSSSTRAQLEEILFATATKDDSPEQLSLEAIMQQPQFQEELFTEARQPELHPRTMDTEWPSIPIQQSLAMESRALSLPAQRPSTTETNLRPEAMLFPPPAALANPAGLPRTSMARRLSDFSVSDVAAPSWGWDSFSGLAEEPAPAPAASLEPAPAPSIVATLQDSYPQPQHQQLQSQQESTHSQLQRILQQQRLKDLMDLNQKQQKNLKIQQEQLEQQRLELQLRDQEQLDQLRAELQARERRDQEQLQQLRVELQAREQQQDQQRRSSTGRMAEPLPRPPPLFKPALLPGGRGAVQLRRPSPPGQAQPQQQQQRKAQSPPGSFQGLFQQPPRNPPY